MNLCQVGGWVGGWLLLIIKFLPGYLSTGELPLFTVGIWEVLVQEKASHHALPDDFANLSTLSPFSGKNKVQKVGARVRVGVSSWSNFSILQREFFLFTKFECFCLRRHLP